VVGVAMRLAPEGPAPSATRRRGTCCSYEDFEDARRVAERMDFPFYVIDLRAEFRAGVVDHWLSDQAAGLTPNPCVRCNGSVRLDAMLELAGRLGAQALATGHYARLGRRGSLTTLHRACDRSRDQAYVLHRLDQRQLGNAVFALGSDESKTDVRAEAASLGLGTAAKPESQDLCFVDTDMKSELRRRLAGRFMPGPIIDGDGAPIGEHEGLPFFTVGQRAGLGIVTDRPDATPRYVIELRQATNTVVIGPRDALRRSNLEAGSFRWVSGTAPTAGMRCEAQLRAHGRAHPARAEADGPDRALISFDAPVDQAAPGQSVVLYRGDEVLGGGVIRRAA